MLGSFVAVNVTRACACSPAQAHSYVKRRSMRAPMTLSSVSCQCVVVLHLRSERKLERMISNMSRATYRRTPCVSDSVRLLGVDRRLASAALQHFGSRDSCQPDPLWCSRGANSPSFSSIKNASVRWVHSRRKNRH